MTFILKNLNVFANDTFKKANILVKDGLITELSVSALDRQSVPVFNFDNCYAFPGFTDVHVHLREPGFSYKETIRTGTLSAAKGGFTRVCTMPNLSPVPDCSENLNLQLKLIKDSAAVKTVPYGAITVDQKGEKISNMEEMAPDVAAFSDDGRGVQSRELMREAMLRAKRLGKMIVAHCEDNSLLNGGCIHEGEYAKLHGIKGISSESE